VSGVHHLRGVLLPEAEERDLWIVDGRITFESVPGADTLATSGWVVPGLVDAHCHIGLGPGGAVEDVTELQNQARADTFAGALLVRDAGSPVDTRLLDGEPDVPRIVRCGRHIARPKRYQPGVAVEVDPEELPAAAAEQAAAGASWVKLVGDWIDRTEGDLAPLWPADALKSAVSRAHEAAARVAVHTFGEEALADLIDAGVDSVEHGTGLTEDLIARLAGQGGALVPTLDTFDNDNIDNIPGIAASARAKFPTYAARMERLHGTARERVRAAFEAGVPIYCGTDAGSMVHHGRVADEILALHGAGLPAEAALAAGSWAARHWLGHPGLEEGAPADLVVYDADPRADLSVLRSPARIVLRGRSLQ
jgi:imidazolonepropionase-like amidohydrolase